MIARMRPPPLLLLALSGCGTLAAHGVDPAEECVPEDTDCVELEPTGEGDDDDDGTPIPNPVEDCTNGADDDDDGDSDCSDPDCTSTCDADGDGVISEALGGNDCDDTDRDVNPGATESCGDGVDSDCDGEECGGFVDGFETPGSPEWVKSGDALWNLNFATPTAHEGSSCGQSGNIGDNQTSTITLTVDFGSPGTVSFWHMGSTEPTYDFLKFYADGVLQQEWSGQWNWTSSSWPVPAGTHDLEWVYFKDGSVDDPVDTVWIDLVEITGGAP